MIYLVHRTSDSKNTVFRYLEDIKLSLDQNKVKSKFLTLNTKIYNTNNLFLDLLFKNFLYLKFLIYLFFQIIFKIKKNDKILITSDPPFFYILLYFLIKIKKINYIIWWQDLFPETLFRNNLIFTIFNFFRRRVIYNGKNIFISPDQVNYIKSILKYDFDYKVINNWNLFNEKKEIKNKNKYLNLAYLGNISISHNIFKLIKDFMKLENRYKFYISYIPRYKKLYDEIISDQRFSKIDYLTDNKFEKLFNKIDVCIVSEKFNQNKFLFPSKVITYLSKKKFILYHGNSNSYLHKILNKYKKSFFIDTKSDFTDKDFNNLFTKYNKKYSEIKMREFNKDNSLQKIMKYLIN